MYYCPVIRKGNREMERKKCISDASFFKKKNYVVKSEQTKQYAASCLLQKKKNREKKLKIVCARALTLRVHACNFVCQFLRDWLARSPPKQESFVLVIDSFGFFFWTAFSYNASPSHYHW